MNTIQVPLQIFPDAQALSEQLAAELLARINAAKKNGRPFLLGCPAGRSLLATCEMLGRKAAASGADLSHLQLVMMDDYVVKGGAGFDYVPLEEPGSCRRVTYELVAKMNAGLPAERQIRAENVWFPDPRKPEAYDRRIEAAGGIDCFLLASGASDGHVAFNPPGSSQFAPTSIVELAPTTRADNLNTFPQYKSIDEVPRFGVSVGLGTIAQLSRSAVLVMTGRSKAVSAQRVLNAAAFDPAWPATIIHACKAPQILLDQAAATLIGDRHDS